MKRFHFPLNLVEIAFILTIMSSFTSVGNPGNIDLQAQLTDRSDSYPVDVNLATPSPSNTSHSPFIWKDGGNSGNSGNGGYLSSNPITMNIMPI